MSAARTGRPATCGAKRLIATPDTAAVRWAVIGPPSRIATGRPVAGVVEHHHGVDRRQAQRVVRREAGDPLHPDEVVAAVGGRAPQVGRHRMHERSIGSRVDPDLRRQLRHR